MKNNDIKKALSKLSQIDPLCYMFVVTAICSYCDQVLEDEAATIKSMERSFIDGEAWVRTAKELVEVSLYKVEAV